MDVDSISSWGSHSSRRADFKVTCRIPPRTHSPVATLQIAPDSSSHPKTSLPNRWLDIPDRFEKHSPGSMIIAVRSATSACHIACR
jgi:hypothetical protein